MEIELPTEKPVRDAVESTEPMAFDSWAARPAPRRDSLVNRDGLDLGALKIFLILAGLTAGMALALRSLF